MVGCRRGHLCARFANHGICVNHFSPSAAYVSPLDCFTLSSLSFVSLFNSALLTQLGGKKFHPIKCYLKFRNIAANLYLFYAGYLLSVVPTTFPFFWICVLFTFKGGISPILSSLLTNAIILILPLRKDYS